MSEVHIPVSREEIERAALEKRRTSLKRAIRGWLGDSIDRYAVLHGLSPETPLTWSMYRDLACFVGQDLGLVGAEVLAEAWGADDLP